MNKTLVGVLLGLALGSGATWLVLRHPAESAAAKPEAAAAKPEEKPNPLRLPPARREAAGIVLAKPVAATLATEAQGFGRVLDPTSLVTVGAEISTARAALTTSEKELDRAKKLFAAGGNASAQAVETAEGAALRDRTALASAQARLRAAWGRDVAENGATLWTALEKGAALVRIDLLPGEAPGAAPKTARIALPGREGNFTAEIVGPAPVADAQVQGASYLALVREPPLPAGTVFKATVAGPGDAAHVLSIPRSAIVYHQGSAWIFVLGEEDTFERKLVTLGSGVSAETVAVLAGLEPEEQVATTGAQQLLAAELQAGGAGEEP